MDYDRLSSNLARTEIEKDFTMAFIVAAIKMGTKHAANVAPAQYLDSDAKLALGGAPGGDLARFIEAAKGTNKQKARWMARMTPVLNIAPTTEEAIYETYLEMIEALD